MAKHDRKGRSRGVPHVRLDKSIFNSLAYRALSPTARAMLFELIGMFNGANNGELYLSTRDATALVGVTDRAAASAALNDLVAHGLAVREETGDFFNRHATCYRLTFAPAKGRAPSNEWRDWNQPDERETKRLTDLAKTKLRAGNSARLGRESRPPAAKVGENLNPSGRDFCQQSGENLEIATLPAGSDSRPQLIYHRDADRLADAAACKKIIALCRGWIDEQGYGAQRRLARLAALTDSKLSRFLGGGGTHRRLTKPELERLQRAVGPNLRVIGGRRGQGA